MYLHFRNITCAFSLWGIHTHTLHILHTKVQVIQNTYWSTNCHKHCIIYGTFIDIKYALNMRSLHLAVYNRIIDALGDISLFLFSPLRWTNPLFWRELVFHLIQRGWWCAAEPSGAEQQLSHLPVHSFFLHQRTIQVQYYYSQSMVLSLLHFLSYFAQTNLIQNLCSWIQSTQRMN